MNVFIAGGTSGIGYSLARHYLSKGYCVGVCGRDPAKITDSHFETLQVFQTDVCEMSSVLSTLKSFLVDKDQLDIFINCAGSYAEDVARKISYEEAEEMLQTNILGTVNCFEAARKAMKKQKSGNIAVIASVSGIMNYENSSLYTKSKRSVIQIADAYRRALKPFGISVTTIAPGYVDTEKLRKLNQNDLSKKPFLINLETAVSIITKAIEDKEKLVIFPAKMKWMMKSLSLLPSSLLNIIMFRKAKWMKND
ncbi:SDR family oxidoreductase [Chryseobacterium sp. BIGb0232]|uniref:SDR family NAD(P)-dependent oxidoreductase n=1 Tax=Chryseobacterium sp. BIGb0232 TaxID=2940598 RepID=UPI000F46B7D9|nr:SDR family oxidoreductase [Chryseobacterium sp. BIGb0232]MCS4303357.1 short-subunit dehydrogenase [Chryseobacterium sp. BIGb0232]ROS11372.1 NADP-dependent 3-hydroxy acid dehydrogenase YdfG [Chryseobacterium nakagawai]